MRAGWKQTTQGPPGEPTTFVYVAGRPPVLQFPRKALRTLFGSWRKRKVQEWATRGGGADHATGMIRAMNREFMDNAVAKDISRDTRLRGRCPHSRRIRRALCPPARRKPIVQGRGDKHHGIRCERRLWNAQAPKRVQCAFAAATHASSGSISDVSNLPGGAKTTAILTCLLAGRRMTRL